MNRKYKTREDALDSMNRSITKVGLEQSSHPQMLKLTVEGPSFAYNQILRMVGLISELSVLEKPFKETIDKVFDSGVEK